MKNKKKHTNTVSKFIMNLLLALPHLISLINNITTLIRVEARLAGKSLVLMIVLSVILGCLLISTWLCVLAILFMYLLSLNWSIGASLLIMLILNIFATILTVSVILRVKENLFFPIIQKKLNEKNNDLL